jgi:hypothetical protein
MRSKLQKKLKVSLENSVKYEIFNYGLGFNY